MSSAHFMKTSRQVEREISDLIDAVDRDLDSSNGEADRKGHFVVSALFSLLLFFGIFGFEHLVGGNAEASQPLPNQKMSPAVVLTKDLSASVGVRLDRIDLQTASIDALRKRVAPSMPIDAQIQVIENSTEDLRSFLKIERGPARQVH